MRFLGILLCLSVFTLTACNRSEPIQVQDIQGNTVQLVNHSKLLIVNYWASWCKPCYEEIPELNALYNAHKKQDDIIVLGVNFEQASKETLKTLVAKLAIQYPVSTTDPAKQLGIKEVANLPATFIFAPNGKLVDTLFGKQTHQSLEQALVAAKKACGHTDPIKNEIKKPVHL
ncbi:TlpA disulfide reductase family protein [soil metagenome]